MSDTDELQSKLFDEYVSRIKQDDSSVPYIENATYILQNMIRGKIIDVNTERKIKKEVKKNYFWIYQN